MKFIILGLICVLLISGCTQPNNIISNKLTIGDVINNPDSYLEKEITVSGTVVDLYIVADEQGNRLWVSPSGPIPCSPDDNIAINGNRVNLGDKFEITGIFKSEIDGYTRYGIKCTKPMKRIS